MNLVYAVEQESVQQLQMICSNKFVHIEPTGVVHAHDASDHPRKCILISLSIWTPNFCVHSTRTSLVGECHRPPMHRGRGEIPSRTPCAVDNCLGQQDSRQQSLPREFLPWPRAVRGVRVGVASSTEDDDVGQGVGGGGGLNHY